MVRNRWAVFGASVVAIVGVALLDYMTGVELRIFTLYYLPIGLGTYYLSTKTGMLLGMLGGIGWLVSNRLSGEDHFSPAVWLINTSTMMISFVTVSFLIGKLKQALERETNLSRQDPLTGLPNRRAFQEQAELLLSGALRSERDFTIVYFDLDNFKTVNDHRGHDEGDLVLRHVGNLLRSSLRTSDAIARLGGDEFAAFMPDTNAAGAAATLERTRNRLVSEMALRQWPVTVSIGSVTFAPAPVTLRDAMHLADMAMYEAKQSGRNRLIAKTAGGDRADSSRVDPVLSSAAPAAAAAAEVQTTSGTTSR